MNSTKPNLFDEVEKFSIRTLNAKDDLQKLFSLCTEFNSEKKFEELAFTGKYLNGLMKVLKSGVSLPEIENLEHVKKDLTNNMELIVSQIREIVSYSDDKTISYFELKYFQFNQQNILHLNLLIEDLDFVKKYLNYKKREP